MRGKYGSTSKLVKLFLLQRDGSKCYLCLKKTDENGSSTLFVEHKNNDKSSREYWHPANLGLAHQSCNIKKNPRGKDVAPRERKREKRKRAGRVAWRDGRPEASSLETFKHEQMRPKYNNHIRFTLPKRMSSISEKLLAELLVHELGGGSSITYARYIREDVAGGILERIYSEGTPLIRFHPEAYSPLLSKQAQQEGKARLTVEEPERSESHEHEARIE